MIIAELYGKIPSSLEDKEDILTSNVFSFFKYSNRSLLKDYLNQIEIKITESDAFNSEFLFWQRYDDGTEPDLIIICGEYYLLFEAKLYSDFSIETSIIRSQIDREIEMGKLAAKNENKKFIYIAITAEYYKNRTKYSQYENKDFLFVWTNWQTITTFIETTLTKYPTFQHREFASDLHSLLIKKRLRSYNGIINLRVQKTINSFDSIFYNIKTSRFKGEFYGFIKNLEKFEKIGQFHKNFQKLHFKEFKKITFYIPEKIFYNENKTK